MLNILHNKHFLIILFSIVFIGIKAQETNSVPDSKSRKINLDKESDSITNNKNLDTLKISLADSLTNQSNDSIAGDSIPQTSKSGIDAIISHSAEDYISENFLTKTTTLHNGAVIDYGNVKISAGHIEINHETNITTARGIKDSLGNYTQRPVVIQDGQESVHDSIKLNYKTEKVIAHGTDSELGGLLTNTDRMKKVNDSVIYVRDIIITTSDKEVPDYHILVSKGKMIPEKKIIAGASQMYIAEVPTPIVLPFAFFPLTKGRRSGLIVPSWGTSNTQGFFLQNGGYYLALSDYYDLTLLADIYTNGSWGLNAMSNYKVRYKYSGAFSLRYENLFNSIRGLSNYSQATNYNIRWNHYQDSKASPTSRFTASVNFGSSQYYRQSLNELNNNSFLNNSLNSSISYQKTFVGTPFNLTSSLTQTQNTNTESITLSFPSLQLGMNRIYPFQPKSGAKKNALHNIGVTYNLKGDYRIDTTEEEFLTNEMFASGRAGVQQDADMSTNLKVLRHFTLSPSVRYKEVWYFDKIEKNYDSALDEVVTDTISGFNSYREYSGGVGMSTTVYGDFQFRKGKLKAIRHTIRPTLSYSYTPDFSFYNKTVQNSADPDDIVEYSPFQTGIYGQPSSGISNRIGISIANTLQAKIADPDSDEDKKVDLLKNFNLSTSYNMAADTLRWSPLNINTGTSILNNKMSINARAILDPYAIDVNGRKINEFNINNGGSLFRMTSAGLNMNYSLSNDSFKKTEDKEETLDDEDEYSNEILDNRGGIFDEKNELTAFKEGREQKKEAKKNKDAYHATIPWNLRIAYAMNYNNSARQDEITSHSLMFSGNVQLSPKWDVGISSGYDLKNKGITYTRLNFYRDLDSWKMNFSWIPFGTRATYTFYIGIKSSILSDIKYDQRKTPDKSLF